MSEEQSDGHKASRYWYALYLVAGACIIAAIAIALRTGLSTREFEALAAGVTALGLILGLSTAIATYSIQDARNGLHIRRGMLAVDVSYLIAMFLFAFVYLLYGLNNLPSWLNYTLTAIWFAMLGSIAISLKGINDWKLPAQWNEGWRLWYWSRPVTGLVIGTLTYAVIQVISGSTPSLAAVAVVSFLFGMQEVRFFNFLSKAATMILTTPGETTGVALTGVMPGKGVVGDTVLISGANIDPAAVVTIGGQELLKLTISRDGTGAAGAVPPLSYGKHDVMVGLADGSAFVLRSAYEVLAGPAGATTSSAVQTPAVRPPLSRFLMEMTDASNGATRR